MSQPERAACRTCGALNERSAYSCESCGVSLRLSPPMRPAPALRAPVVAPKSPLANDTLDIETELPDEELDHLLASHTPISQTPGLDELATFDEAADGLAPSVSFDDLQVLSPGTNGPPLYPRKEPSLQESIRIDPLLELPQNTEVLSAERSAPRGWGRWVTLTLVLIALGVGLSQRLLSDERLSQASRPPRVTPLPSTAPSAEEVKAVTPHYGAVSVRPDLRALLSPQVGVDLVVLRAQAKAWLQVSARALQLLKRQQPSGDARVIHAQLTLLEARLFEASLQRLSAGASEGSVELSSEDRQTLAELEAALTLAPEEQREEKGPLTVWVYSLLGRHQEAAELTQRVASSGSKLSWALSLPALSTGWLEPEQVAQLQSGEGCERALYALRAAEVTEGVTGLSAPYQSFSSCLTQLIAQADLNHEPPKPLKPLTPLKPLKTKRTAMSAGRQRTSARAAASYQGLMTQGMKALERGRVAQAEVYFKRASAQRPKSPDPVAQRGWCALAKGNARGSLRHFKTALSMKSDHADSMYGLGYAYEQLRDWRVARGHFERYLKRYPKGAKVRIIQNKLSRMPK